MDAELVGCVGLLQDMLGSCLDDVNEVEKPRSQIMIYDNSMVAEHCELTGHLQAALKVRPFMRTMIAGSCQLPPACHLSESGTSPDRSRPEVGNPAPQLPSLKRYVPQTTSELATNSGFANQSPRPLAHATQK
jgi:hypothetical protein